MLGLCKVIGGRGADVRVELALVSLEERRGEDGDVERRAFDDVGKGKIGDALRGNEIT